MPDSPHALQLVAAIAREKSGSEDDVPSILFSYNDVGNGKRFARDWRGLALYCFEWKEWLIYTGGRWQRDNTGEVFRMAKETAARIEDEVPISGDATALFKHCNKAQSAEGLASMINMARSEIGIPCTPLDFETSPYLFNCLNGTLELAGAGGDGKGEEQQLAADGSPLPLPLYPLFRPHRKEDMLLHQAPVSYDPNAVDDLFLKTITRTMPPFEGSAAEKCREPGTYHCIEHPDRIAVLLKEAVFPLCGDPLEGHVATWRCNAMLEFLQRFAGLCLSGDVSDEAFFFFIGPAATGKGTFLSTMQALLGNDLSTSLPVEHFLSTKFDKLPIHIHAAKGKRLTVVSENEQNARFNSASLKMWAGGDQRVGKGMRENLSVSTPTDKLVFQTNHVPQFNDSSGGIKRRAKFTSFKVVVPESEIDRHLKEKLRRPEILSSVLNWALAGWKDWQAKGGLATPAAVRTVTESLLSLQDQIASFIATKCVVGINRECTRKELYEVYKLWCEEAGEGKPMASRRFVPAIRDQGFEERKSNADMFWIGVEVDHGVPAGNAPNEAGIRAASERASESDLFKSGSAK